MNFEKYLQGNYYASTTSIKQTQTYSEKTTELTHPHTRENYPIKVIKGGEKIKPLQGISQTQIRKERGNKA